MASFNVATSQCRHHSELEPSRTRWTTSSRHHWSTTRLRLAEECTRFYWWTTVLNAETLNITGLKCALNVFVNCKRILYWFPRPGLSKHLKRRLCMAELDPRPTVMRRLCRVAHLAAVLPSHHSPSSKTESRSPVRGQLVAYSCLSVYVHSLPPSVDPPQPPLR